MCGKIKSHKYVLVQIASPENELTAEFLGISRNSAVKKLRFLFLYNSTVNIMDLLIFKGCFILLNLKVVTYDVVCILNNPFKYAFILLKT